MFSSTTILNIKITLNDKKDIIDHIVQYLKKNTAESLTIFTPNPEQIMQAWEMPEFADVLNSSDINLPDGQRLVWANKLVGSGQLAVDRKKIPQTANRKPQTFSRIAGIDFMEELIRIASENGYPVAFIGGRKGSSAEALNKLKIKYPGLEGWTEEAPELGIRKQELGTRNNKSFPDSLFMIHNSSISAEDYFKQLVKRINDSRTRLVFVGLGAPKQEFFIEELKYYLSLRSGQLTEKQSQNQEIATSSDWRRSPRNDREPIVLMSVGGAFDIISGKLSRTPYVFRNLEFLWRLLLEPTRFFRQLKLFKFICLVLWQRFVLK